MSQYPPPNSPLPYGGPSDPNDADLFAPARRASLLLFIIGGLAIMAGLCLGVGIWSVPTEKVEELARQLLKEQDKLPPGMSVEQAMRGVYTILGGIIFLLGLALVVLGFFVRRAEKVSTTIAVILCSLASIYFLLNAVGGVVMGLNGNSMMLMGGCMSMVPLIVFSLATTWLMRVLKSVPQIRMARAQQQSQYRESQQQRQAYQAGPGEGGYSPQNFQFQPYDAIPQPGKTAPPLPRDPASPPVRHPPLPPDQNAGGPYGNPPRG